MNLFLKNKNFKRLLYLAISMTVAIPVISIAINSHVNKTASPYIHSKINQMPRTYTALVLGAKVYSDGGLSAVVYDRIIKAAELYKRKKVKKILVSGDHGQKNYDEVNAMKNYLVKLGIPPRDIFMDHAGFNTYNSIVRAREVFLVRDLVIVTQKFHLTRAVYIAREKGMKAFGYTADRRRYLHAESYDRREFLARVKAYFEIFFNVKPVYLGKKIPITGNSKLSWD